MEGRNESPAAPGKRLSKFYMTCMPSHRSSQGEPVSSLAEMLLGIPPDLPSERVSLRDLLKSCGPRAGAMVLLIFSIPAIVPTPGLPAGMIFGSALALLSLQLIFRGGELNLPSFLSRWSISRDRVEQVIVRSARTLERFEHRMPRGWPGIAGRSALRPVCCVVFVMAVLIALPIPFGNVVPGFAVLMFALGLTQRNGFAVAAGLALALLACVFAALAIMTGLHILRNHT
jgi:hypothetical protein